MKILLFNYLIQFLLIFNYNFISSSLNSLDSLDSSSSLDPILSSTSSSLDNSLSSTSSTISSSSSSISTSKSNSNSNNSSINSILSNWNVYEELNKDINITESILYIQNIPLHIYWDIYKGGYKLGVIAERLIDKYPELITYSLVKNSTKPPISLINITTIDTNTLFMHVLVVIKYLSTKLLKISSELDLINNNSDDFNIKLDEMKNLTGNEWKSVSQLKHERNIKEIKIESLNKRIEYMKHRTTNHVKLIEEYYKVYIK